MRQIADPGLPRFRQTTPDACRETNIAPAAFSLNQNSAVCLPLVSDNQRLIWVHSNQTDLQLDGTEELDKAFDKFPYLTEKQTAALAQRCSLHPDQVKVWFMLQRLRYGISWDYKDIQEVRRKVRPSQGKEKLKEEIEEDRREKKQKREVNESGEKAGKDRKEQSANEGRMTGENVRANEQLERKIKQEQPVKKVKDRKVDTVEEDKRNTQKKRKRITVADKMGKKRMKQVDEGVVERAGEVEIRSDQVETVSTRKKKAKANKRLMSVQEWPADKSFVVPDEPLDVSPLLFPQALTQTFEVPVLSDNQIELLKRADVFPTTPKFYVTSASVNNDLERKPEMEAKLEEELHVNLTNHDVVITDIGKLKELIETNNPVVADGSTIFTPQQDSHVADSCSLPTRIRCNTKTQSQLTMMKVAFSHCQYPDSEDYDRLAMVIGVPRYMLVQWFGDMRYYIKKGRPRWMTQEQHSQALANIKYRQCLNALAKVQPIEGIENTAWKMVLERGESFGENKSLKVPPE